MTEFLEMRVLPAILAFAWLSSAALAEGPSGTSDAPIDLILAQAHRDAGIEPAALVDASIFLRRLTLDLIGRVPTINELETFLASPDPIRTIDQLLSSDSFADYWSQVWTSILVGRNPDRPTDRDSLQRWLAARFAENLPMDQIAFDLISAQGVTAVDGAVNFLVGNLEDPTTSVSRVFLGVQLDCARCHDHPDDRWTQQDYQRMRRFFSAVRVDEVSGGVRVRDAAGTSGDIDEQPQFLTGAVPQTAAWRREMAYMTVRSKPFARAIGNRVWQLLLGRGVVSPVDGLSESARPSVEELHDVLGDQLRRQKFNLRRLIQTICSSDAYRRRSDPSPTETSRSVEVFATRRPRPLLPEQMLRSYWRILRDEELTGTSLNERSIEWLGRSAAASGSSDPLQRSRTSQGLLVELSSPISAPWNHLDPMFLSTLSRRPTESEHDRLAGASAPDLMYALLHCNEFVFYP
ncbi:MAG: DUF1549 domain-containing protein [Planctomycetota bacterium]